MTTLLVPKTSALFDWMMMKPNISLGCVRKKTAAAVASSAGVVSAVPGVGCTLQTAYRQQAVSRPCCCCCRSSLIFFVSSSLMPSSLAVLFDFLACLSFPLCTLPRSDCGLVPTGTEPVRVCVLSSELALHLHSRALLPHSGPHACLCVNVPVLSHSATIQLRRPYCLAPTPHSPSPLY